MSYKQELQVINTRLNRILTTVYNLSDGIQRLPLPIEVNTEGEMEAILATATEADIGAIYKYTGNPGKYTSGELYIIAEEAV